MDRVLAVTFGPSRSQARWLGGDERDELITEDSPQPGTAAPTIGVAAAHRPRGHPPPAA